MIEKLLERIAVALEALVLLGDRTTPSTTAAPAAPAAAAPAADDDPFGDAPGESAKLTIKDVLQKAKEKADGGHKDKVIAMIKKAGVTKASEIPEEKWAKFVEALDKLK